MNNRYVSGIFMTLFVILLIASTVMAQMGGDRAGMGQGMGYGMGPWSASDMMQQGQQLRHEAGMQGMGFMHSNANLFGHYVTFEIDELTGAITQYGIAGNEIFDSVTVEDFGNGETQVMGSMTRILDSDGKTIIQVHDNPAAVINIVSSDAHIVNFNLAENITAVKEDDMVKIESADVVVYIVYSAAAGSFEVNVSDGKVIVDAPENSSIVVRALPVNMPELGQMNRMMVQEIGRNRVGAEVCLGMNGSMNMVNYSKHLRIQMEEMTTNRVRLKLDSTDPTGKILAFNLDNTSLELQEREKLRLYYDNVPMQCVDDPELVTNAIGKACFISQQSRNRAQIMINVPEFSEHIIEIVVEDESGMEPTEAVTGIPTKVPGYEAVIALSALLLVVYLIRRKE
jgi:hypothetical protein